ncbi:MAG: hypothetical protein ACLUHC_04100 [Clostridia bacterium]
MKNVESLARVHTHTHTGILNNSNRITRNISKDRNIMLVLEFDTG